MMNLRFLDEKLPDNDLMSGTIGCFSEWLRELKVGIEAGVIYGE